MNIWAMDLRTGDVIWYEGVLYEVTSVVSFANGRSLTVTVWEIDTGLCDELWLEYNQQIWKDE